MATRPAIQPVDSRSLRDDQYATDRLLAEERDNLDIALYDQLVDALALDVTDTVVRTVETFALETSTRLSVARKPRGGVSILRSHAPGGTLDIALERFAQRLVCRSWFTSELGRTHPGPHHEAHISVRDNGSGLEFIEGGRPLTLTDVERTWVRPFLARI
jgi:hypothetical protein